MPAIAFGVPIWIIDALELVERRVADGSGLPKERVFSFLGDPVQLVKVPPAEKFIAVVPGDFPVHGPAVSGGGAAHTVFNGRIGINVFARLGTDKELSDIGVLRDRQRGIGELVRRVAKSVQVWVQTNSAGTASQFCEPTRLIRVKFNPRTPPSGWAWAVVELEAKFRTDFTAAG